MILDAILNLLAGMLEATLGGVFALIPEPPAWWYDAVDVTHDVMVLVKDFDTFLPVTFTITVAGAVITTWFTTLAAELIRMVVSYITLGGGAK